MRAGLKLLKHSVLFAAIKLMLLFGGSTTLAGGQDNLAEVTERYVKLWAWECMTQAIFFEARNQPIAGQYAVAYVLWNRAERKVENVCRELYRDSQFSFVGSQVQEWTSVNFIYYRGRDATAYARSRETALRILSQNDLRSSAYSRATHFHTKQMRVPAWARSSKLKRVAVIGDHIFYRELRK